VTLLYACSQATTAESVALSGCECDLDLIEIPIDDLIDAASDTLFLASGGIVSGRCQTTYRPCADFDCYCPTGPYCGCSCDASGIPLPGVDPSVELVKIDGDAFTSWVLINGRVLARTDGSYWPTSQSLHIRDTEDNTFAITVESGLDWMLMASMAANELVCEFAKLLSGRQTSLPPGTVSAVMDGVAVQVNRLPGQQEIEAVGLTHLARFIGTYSNRVVSEVRSPELTQGWELYTLEFAP
jgi:hypothetical protein